MTKIRQHPQLRDSWPPGDWGGANAPARGDKYLIGENADATSTGVSMRSDRITLEVKYEDNTLSGSIMCEDQAFRERLHAFLSQHIGLSLPEIGDLEIDF